MERTPTDESYESFSQLESTFVELHSYARNLVRFRQALSIWLVMMNRALVFFRWWVVVLVLSLNDNALALPRITVQPSPLTNSVSLGAALTNRITATTTNPPLAYQWQLNGADLAGFTNSTVVLTNIRAATAGRYTALVTDTDGSVTSAGWDVHVDATFEQIHGLPMLNASGVGSTWADYDRDGFPDLFLGTTVGNPTQFGANRLYRNHGNGTFSAVPAALFPDDGGVMWAGWADYDNDGWLDLFGGKINNDLLYRNNGNGSFSKITNSATTDGGGTVGCAWADFDNDGFADLISVNEGRPNSLFRNDANGGFVKVVNSILTNSPFSQAAEWADYDNDGRIDLFIANYQNNRSFLYRNQGGGNFTRITNGTLVTEAGRFSGAAWGDYDNDGFLDLFVRAFGPNNALHRNNRDGTFTKVTTSVLTTDASHSYAAVWGDYDNDGWQDLFVSNGGTMKRDALYRNNHNGSFTRITTGSITSDNSEGRTAAWVDYDRDGFLDLWIANTFGNLNSLYRNNGNSNAWLRVRLEGRVSNRAALGAKVRLEATMHGTNFWQLRQITGTELEAHFGLGDATTVDLLRVEWPSGSVQQFTNVAPAQFLTIFEPAQLSIAPVAQGQTEISLRGGKGVIYEVQATTDWQSWLPVMTLTNQNGTLRFLDTGATNNQRFFRAYER